MPDLGADNKQLIERLRLRRFDAHDGFDLVLGLIASRLARLDQLERAGRDYLWVISEPGSTP